MEKTLSTTDSEIIELAWSDRVSFDTIKMQAGLSEKDIIRLMRRSLKPSSFRLWRARVSGRAAKHSARQNASIAFNNASNDREDIERYSCDTD